MLRTLTSCQAIRLQPDLISWNAVCSAAEKCSKWNQESTHGKDWNMASKASWTGNILYELSESAGWQSLVVKNTTSGPYDLWILMTCFADARHTTLHSSEINITHIRITVICSLEVLCCLRRVCISIPLCTDFVCIAVVGILFARTFRTLFASFCNCRSLLFCRNYNQLHWLQMPSPMGPASLLQKQQLGKLPCNSNVPCRRWIWESKLGCVTVSLCHAFAIAHHCTIAIIAIIAQYWSTFKSV